MQHDQQNSQKCVSTLADFHKRLVTLFAEQEPSCVGMLGDGSYFWINDSTVFHCWPDDQGNVSDWDQSAFDEDTIALVNAWLFQPVFKNRSICGSIGKHDWCIGIDRRCESGYPVFVDDRQLSYRPTVDLAREYAMEIIARLQADGDYRLNDKPSGFLPPELNPGKLQQDGKATNSYPVQHDFEGLKAIGQSVMQAMAHDGFRYDDPVELGDEVMLRLLSLDLPKQDRAFIGNFIFAQHGHGGGLRCSQKPFKVLSERKGRTLNQKEIRVTTEGPLDDLTVTGTDIPEDQLTFALQAHTVIEVVNQDNVRLKLSFDMDGESLVAEPVERKLCIDDIIDGVPLETSDQDAFGIETLALGNKEITRKFSGVYTISEVEACLKDMRLVQNALETALAGKSNLGQ